MYLLMSIHPHFLCMQVGRFLTMLTNDSDPSLRFLSFRIDFNERYASTVVNGDMLMFVYFRTFSESCIHLTRKTNLIYIHLVFILQYPLSLSLSLSLSFSRRFTCRYKAIIPEYKAACSPFRAKRPSLRTAGPSSLSQPAFTAAAAAATADTESGHDTDDRRGVARVPHLLCYCTVWSDDMVMSLCDTHLAPHAHAHAHAHTHTLHYTLSFTHTLYHSERVCLPSWLD